MWAWPACRSAGLQLEAGARRATLQRLLWAVIPYVPAGLFDVTSAMRPGITGVLHGCALPIWNI